MLYNRLFTFGCSFTYYHWMTWADILGAEFKEFYNFGVIGGGNQQILTQLLECSKMFQLNENDTVIIMWSSICREDRYIKGQWIRSGNIFQQDIYPKEFVEKFADVHGYLKRDLSFISAVKHVLDNLKINYYFLAMVPIDNLDDWLDTNNDPFSKELFKLYNEEIKLIKPSVYEIVFNYDWNSRIPRPRYSAGKGSTDYHPTPYEHLEYIKKIFPEIIISKNTLNLIDESHKTITFL